jgi:hypothetical protein
MEKALKDKEFIGLALDYMEPKSKKHKVFCGFIIGSKSILLFETLDGKGETNIKHLIETQAKFCKENIKLYMSDADTTLIYYTDEDRTKGVNHLCSVHFLNLSYILGQDEDKLIMKEIKTCLQYIWEQFKRAENIKKRNSTLETLPTNLIAYNKNLLETIDIIEKSKGQRNESYASLNAYEKLEDLITVLDKLDETTLDIPKLLIHKNSLPIVKFRKKVENKTKPLRNFIHLIKKQSNIINNTSISKEETLKSLDKIFNIKDLEYEYEELNRKSGKYSIKRKYQKKYNYLFNQSKKKYLKYRDKIANAKDFNLKDMTNNLCENSFSFFRIWFRKLIGSRNHSDREYLEYLPFFHLQNDIDSNISLRLLFTKHIQRYNRIHDVSLHNLDIYKRFHYPQKRFSSLLTNMEVVGESSP